MNIFDFRRRLIDDYAAYTRSFLQIRDPHLGKFVEGQLAAGVLWPEPLIQLNPSFEPGATVDELISQMLGIVYRAQAESKWERLKICASDECRWAFYDRSKNRGGTWCQMETCGNRINNRAYRGRRAGAAR